MGRIKLSYINFNKHILKVVVGVYASEFVDMAYRGILTRDPEAGALKSYAARLAKSHDLTLLLAEIAHSDEHWQKLFAIYAPQLVTEAYRAILGRTPDPSGLQTYTKYMAAGPEGLEKFLSELVTSEEFTTLFKKKNEPAVVFLHIQKTAGTSMQQMLKNVLGKRLLAAHTNLLVDHSLTELSTYSAFAGHFNYDSICRLSNRPKLIFTFVREPKARVLSAYYFWRAHNPTSPFFHKLMKLANEQQPEQFFASDEPKLSEDLWNHMTWAIMGERQWKEWRKTLAEDAGNAAGNIENTFRLAVRNRLKEFSFIGLQEDFDRSVNMLFKLFGWVQPAKIPKVHTLELLTATAPHFKKKVSKQPMSPQLEMLLDQYVQLDRVVYEEAKLLYSGRVEQYERNKSGMATPNRRNGIDVSTRDIEDCKLVFLHLPKTGGTTLHDLLLAHFPEDRVCPERFNGLRYFTAAELAHYRLFSGHFDLPSVHLIPGRKLIFTLLREPVNRLVSLYHFCRAHRTEVIERERLYLAHLANKYTMRDFFQAEEVRSHPAINNTYSRVLTSFLEGKRWEEEHNFMCNQDNSPNCSLALKKLKALDAFGIMERYNESIALIFSTIGLPFPEKIEKRQVLDVIVERGPRLRKIEKQPVTDEIMSLIADLVDVDMKIYREACQIFEKRLATMKGSPA